MNVISLSFVGTRRLRLKYMALWSLVFLVIIAVVNICVTSWGTVRVSSRINRELLSSDIVEVVEKRTSKRERLCRKDFKNSTGINWDTVEDWDYRLYNRPHFLNNYKNPCYLTSSPDRKNNRTSGQQASGRLKLKCLPYFIIAGFPKAGTTDVWHRLMFHSDIVINHKKEPNFFHIGRMEEGRFDNAVFKYTKIFDRAAEGLLKLVCPIECQDKPFPYNYGIIGEGSVDTIFDLRHWPRYPGNEHCVEPVITNADYLYQINPSIKVIIMLRNPADRLFSDYLYEARFVKYKLGLQLFHDEVVATIKKHTDCRKYHSIRACAYNYTLENYKIRLRVGMYSVFISDWLDVFPKENILVLDVEEINGDKKVAAYKRIFQFLNIRPFTPREEMRAVRLPNSNRRLDHEEKIGEMLPETRELINDFYKPFNDDLTRLYPHINYNVLRKDSEQLR